MATELRLSPLWYLFWRGGEHWFVLDPRSSIDILLDHQKLQKQSTDWSERPAQSPWQIHEYEATFNLGPVSEASPIVSETSTMVERLRVCRCGWISVLPRRFY
jgi:hypothetical protein